MTVSGAFKAAFASGLLLTSLPLQASRELGTGNPSTEAVRAAAERYMQNEAAKNHAKNHARLNLGVVECEEYILANMNNPGSYNRIRLSSLNLGEYWHVKIEYTHFDGGRSTLKAWQTCDYPIIDGKAETSEFLNLEGSDGTGLPSSG